MKLAIAVFACSLAVSAAGMDGHWTAQIVRGGKAAAAAAAPAPFSLDLKTSGGAVTGTVAFAGKKQPRIQKIENGKLDGDRLTFTTSQRGKNPVNFSWEVTLQADKLTGTRTRDGANRGQKFTAERD